MSADIRSQALQAALAHAEASGDHAHVLADAAAYAAFLSGESE